MNVSTCQHILYRTRLIYEIHVNDFPHDINTEDK